MLLKNSISHATINDNTPKILRNDGAELKNIDSVMEIADVDDQQPPTVGNREVNETPFLSDKQLDRSAAMNVQENLQIDQHPTFANIPVDDDKQNQ